MVSRPLITVTALVLSLLTEQRTREGKGLGSHGKGMEMAEGKKGLMEKTLLVNLVLAVSGLAAIVYAGIAGQHAVYGISRQVPWGVVIGAYAFFAAVAIGCCLVAAMSRVYGLTGLAPVARRAVFVSMVSSVAAMVLLMGTMENPWRMLVYNAVSPNPLSNIWWLVTLTGIMAGCMFLEFAAMFQEKGPSRFIIGFIGAVVGVGASNNLGGLLAGAMDPPLWFGGQLLVVFLCSTVLAGAAVMVLVVGGVALLSGEEVNGDQLVACQVLAAIIHFMLAILAIVMIIRFYTVFTTENDSGLAVATILLRGKLSVSFWLVEVGIGLVGPIVLLLSTRENIRLLMIAAAMALTGLFMQRIDLVLAGQFTPKLGEWQRISAVVSYLPSWLELVAVAGAVGIVGFGVLSGERLFSRFWRTASHPFRNPF